MDDSNIRNIRKAERNLSHAVTDDRDMRSAQTRSWLISSRRRKAAVTRAERRLGKALVRAAIEDEG